MSFDWTPERKEELKQMVADGHSYSDIGAKFRISRNAAIGAGHRLGLANSYSPRHTTVRRDKPRSPRPHKPRSDNAVQRPMARVSSEAAHEPEPELIENVIPLRQRRTLLQLTEDTCRWPIGDPASPEFFFCGAKPLSDRPYCNYHSRAAYETAETRRKRARQASASSDKSA